MCPLHQLLSAQHYATTTTSQCYFLSMELVLPQGSATPRARGRTPVCLLKVAPTTAGCYIRRYTMSLAALSSISYYVDTN